jgi:hypothetical protein
MSWNHLALGVSDLLGILFVTRLLTLRLHRVYRVFSVFVLYELFSFSVAWLSAIIRDPRLDYRIVFIVLELVGAVLMLWMVYELLAAILGHLPGIYRLSRRILNYTFLIAFLIALLTAKAEYATEPGMSFFPLSLDGAVRVSIVTERIISTAALVVLLLILAFVLWFPVQMPKNLVFFSFGFVAYFSCKTGLYLAHSYLPPQLAAQVGTMGMAVIDLCFIYWAITISREGEAAPLRIGHRWHKDEQQRLLSQLEGMNTVLLRGVRK